MTRQLEARVVGHGRDVVLLHGSPQDPGDLDGLVDHLACTHRIHRVHLPGYAGAAGADTFAWDTASDAVAAYVRSRCSRPWLVGMSGGAYRALRVATMGVEVVGVCAIAGFAHLPAAIGDGLRGAADALEAGADLTASLVGAWFSPGFSSSYPEHCSAVVRRCLSAADPAIAAADVRALTRAPDLREALARVKAPLRFLTGGLDAATPVDLAGAAVASAPNATLGEVKGSGHMVHHEALEEVCEWLSLSIAQGTFAS